VKSRIWVSRTDHARQILLSNMMGVPSVMIMDYEHAQTPLLLRPRWEIVPDVMLKESLHCRSRDRIRTYKGIKEDVYAPRVHTRSIICEGTRLNEKDILVTVRPPANEAHYHNPESDIFFRAFMDRLAGTPGTARGIAAPNKAQETQIRAEGAAWFKDGKVIIPGARWMV